MIPVQKPITKYARVRRTKQQRTTFKQNTKQGSLYDNNVSNSILIYLLGNLTAQKAITYLA